MENKEQFPIGEIEYSRYRKSHSDKIILENGEYKAERKTTVKGFDSLLRKWKKIKVTKETLPLSTMDPEPKKQIILDTIIKRNGQDSHLKPLVKYFKQKYKVSVFADYPHLFLTFYNGIIVINNLKQGKFMPMGLSKGYPHVKVEKQGEETEISKQDLIKLLKKEKLPIFEEFGIDNELRALV